MNKKTRDYSFLFDNDRWNNCPNISLRGSMRLDVLKVFRDNLSIYKTSSATAVSPTTVWVWVNLFEEGGAKALDSSTRIKTGCNYIPTGKPRGKNALISSEEDFKKLKSLILNNQEKLGYMNLRMASDTINSSFNINISSQWASKLLKRCGLKYFHGRWIEVGENDAR